MMKKTKYEDIKDNGSFAIVLKCLLAKENITQAEFANAMGLSCATVTHYVQGKFTPSQKTLIKIAEFFNVNPQVFYGDTEEFTGYLTKSQRLFSNNLKKLAQQNNESQKSIAEAIGVSRQAVNYYFCEKMMPTRDVLEKIAEHFNISTDDLFKDDEVKQIDEPMKILVSKMPSSPQKCMFFSEPNRCKCNFICEFKDGQCPCLDVLKNQNDLYCTIDTRNIGMTGVSFSL